MLRPLLAAQGWRPDALLCASDVPAGRPAPYMNQIAAMQLGAPDVAGCAVLGDTVLDMQAARNAGMWAVGVTLTGTEVGKTWNALLALPVAERDRLREKATARLKAAGAHIVVDSVLEAPAALEFLRRPGAAAFKRWHRHR